MASDTESPRERRLGIIRPLLLGLILLALAQPASTLGAERSFQIAEGTKGFDTTLPSNSVATYVWSAGSSTVESWITTPAAASAHQGVLRQSDMSFGAATSPSETPTVSIEPNTKFQLVDGFGAAITESAADVLKGSVSGTRVLEEAFSPNGADFSIARVPIGASDFTAAPKGPAEDTEAQDLKYLIPELQHAEAINPGLKILATPWSAPGRFKNAKKLVGAKVCSNRTNRLQPTAFAPYARYLTSVTAAYQRNGLPFWMLSLQNEPRNCNGTYPTMELEPEEEAKLSELVSTDMHEPGNGLTAPPPTLLGWDHNWTECNSKEWTRYPAELLQNPNGIGALGFHSYCNGEAHELAGVPASMPIYVTESTGVEQFPSPNQNLPNEVQKDLIDPLRAGAKGSLYWNLALTECGPQFGGGKKCVVPKTGAKYGGCTDCRPMFNFKKSGSVEPEQDLFYWEQASKFIRPGARIIASTVSPELDTIAALNPDGSTAVVVLNGGGKPNNEEAAPEYGRPADSVPQVSNALWSEPMGDEGIILPAKDGSIVTTKCSSHNETDADVPYTLQQVAPSGALDWRRGSDGNGWSECQGNVRDRLGNDYFFFSNATGGHIRSVTSQGWTRWTTAALPDLIDEDLYARPTVGANGNVYFALYDAYGHGYLVGVSQGSGEIVLTKQLGFPLSLTAYTGGLVVVDGYGGVQYLNYDGTEKATYPVTGIALPGASFSPGPEGTVFISGPSEAGEGCTGSEYFRVAKVSPTGVAWTKTDSHLGCSPRGAPAATPNGGVVTTEVVASGSPAYVKSYSSEGTLLWTKEIAPTVAGFTTAGAPLVDEHGIVMVPYYTQYECETMPGNTCTQLNLYFASQASSAAALPALQAHNETYTLSTGGSPWGWTMAVASGRVYVIAVPYLDNETYLTRGDALVALSAPGLGEDYERTIASG